MLDVNQEVRVEVPLLAGKSSERVNVTATRSLVRTDSASVGGVIDNRQITGTAARRPQLLSSLSLLLPGVVPAAAGSAGSVRGDFAININGAREDSNNFLLDGVFNGDPKLNGIGVTPPVDAVREFEVATSTYDASFGRNGGGQVNVVLQIRRQPAPRHRLRILPQLASLDARNFFAPAHRKQRRSISAISSAPRWAGPWSGTVRSSSPTTRAGACAKASPEMTNVPTAARTRGRFFAQQPSYCHRSVHAARRSPAIVDSAGPPRSGRPGHRGACIRCPTASVPGQNFVSSPRCGDRDDHFDVRLDHSLRRRPNMTFRYSFGDRSLFEPSPAPASSVAVPGFGNNVPTARAERHGRARRTSSRPT